jgi:LmbE family N-acetylglucosaminyl deacetylase
MAHPSPNQYVDVTDTFDRKIAALRAHVSQTAHMDDLEIWLRERLGQIATDAGLPAGHLAEAFAVHSTA